MCKVTAQCNKKERNLPNDRIMRNFFSYSHRIDLQREEKMSNKFLPKWDTIDSAQTAVSLHLLPPAILSISLTLFLFYTSHIHSPCTYPKIKLLTSYVNVMSKWDHECEIFSYSEDRALFYSKTLSWKKKSFLQPKKLLKERENFHIWWGKKCKKNPQQQQSKAESREEKRIDCVGIFPLMLARSVCSHSDQKNPK